MLSDFLQPGLILIISGLLLLLLPAALRRAVQIAGPLLTLAAVLFVLGGTPESGAPVQLGAGLAESGALTAIFALIFALIALVAAIYNLHEKNRYELAVEAVYAGSSISVVFAEHWIGMLIFWELMAVASWLIVVSSRTVTARRVGFRYLLVHMLGGNLLLAGIVIKLSQGATAIEMLSGSMDAASWLILAGVAVNAAIPPLNAWIADAYPESTMGGTVYMGSYTTKVGVFCLIRLFAGTELLLYFGVFMAVYGVCMALIENDLRRLLSYHIVSQVGYMVAALAMGGELGVDGASAHAFNHILYKGTLLMCAGAVIKATGLRKITDLHRLGGLAHVMPVTAVCFLISSLAIAGFPLLNGFVSKALIMNAAAGGGYHWAELLLLLASVGTFMSVTLKINYFVFFGRGESEGALPAEGAQPYGSAQPAKGALPGEASLPLNMKLAMIAGATACVVTGISPGLVYGLTPFGSDGHPFTVDHVTQYIGMFAGAALVFVMYIRHMEPAAKLTLDTDWLYRKPLKYAFWWLCGTVDGVRLFLGGKIGAFCTWAVEYLHDPRRLLKAKPRPARDCLEDDDVLQKPVGWLIALTFAILLAATFYVLIRLA